MSLLLKAGEFDAFDWFSSSVSFFGGAANRLMSFGWGKYTLAMKLPANDVRGGNAQMPNEWYFSGMAPPTRNSGNPRLAHLVR